jgi:hypothetical protein
VRKLIALIAVLALLGCGQRTKVDDSLATDYAADDAQAQMDFWHGLADRSAVTNDEALHALVSFAQGEGPSTYEQRLQWLKQRDLLPADFDRPPSEIVRRGTVARVLAPMLEIEGGLTMRLVGPEPRYALRALMHRDIMPESSVQQGLTGIQMVGIISRARQYRESHS